MNSGKGLSPLVLLSTEELLKIKGKSWGVAIISLGEQGWRSGESARLPPMCNRLDSRTWRHVG